MKADKLEWNPSRLNSTRLSNKSRLYKSTMLTPTTHLGPFSCDLLPPPFNCECKAQKVNFRRTSPGSCSRLPPRYQGFCRALPPPDPVNNFGGNYNLQEWPNIASSDPETFADQRQGCGSFPGVGVARGFYNCLWGQNGPPAENAMINTANFGCPHANPRCAETAPLGTMTGQWEQVQYGLPSVWTRK